jgi:poly(3-hydroxybutyrate) depolymerase
VKFFRRATALLLISLGACSVANSSTENVIVADPRQAQLSALLVPQPSTRAPAGLREISIEGAKPALLYVPSGYTPDTRMPLVVMLHGAGGTARHSVDLVRKHADRLGFIVLAPASHAYSWDIIAGRAYGPDVARIDEALSRVSSEYALDPARIAIAGFSDGASYALSLGLANGRLFSRVIAFSPGFMAPPRQEGSPRIFISHGLQDQVLPIDRCSRRIVPQLKAAGLDVDYREFPGGHTVPEELAAMAFSDVKSDKP